MAIIPPDIVDAMRALIAPLDTADRRDAYRTGNYPRADKTVDVERRYRWDLLWHSGANRVLWGWDAFHDVKDSHIDTALRSIVPPLA